jgi:putative PEP-CTERM system histidine kinase
MNILVFIFLSFIVSSILLVLNFLKSGFKPYHPPLFAIGFLYPAGFFCAVNIFPFDFHSIIWAKFFIAFLFSATFSSIGLLRNFYRYHILAATNGRKKRFYWNKFLPVFNIAASVGCFFISGGELDIVKGEEFFLLSNISVAILFLQLFMQMYVLFVLENIFRFANEHQRRIGRMFFFAFGVISLFNVIFLIYSVLFQGIVYPYLIALIVIIGICLPIMLLGLFRVRIGTYDIGISRQTIFSSISIFVFGAFCLAIGLATYIARQFNLEFSFFESFLMLFSVVFFAILVLLSENMRKRIRLFVNSHIFVRKFDYREEFFWLHQLYLSSDDLNESISTLTSHLLYALNYETMHVFLLNHGDRDFHLHGNLKKPVENGCVISGDNAIVLEFLKDKRPIEFNGKSLEKREAELKASQRELIDSLGITAIFPVFHKEVLLGLLMVKFKQTVRLDIEDKMLISIFTMSIGNVFFKFRMIKENIENKQFESFHHLAAFLVHDIKNQVATLSLIMKNADKNIGNPEFQQSLLRSIGNCSVNLQKLVDKLSAPPKSDQLNLQTNDIGLIMTETIENMNLSKLQGIVFKSNIGASDKIPVDKESIYYIFKNLIVNALEAMNNKGALTIVTGDCKEFPRDLLSEFKINEHLLRNHIVYVLIEDTGMGMSNEFIEKQLFRPFSTTKDKGIGIGLYQCHTLIEKMNGTLLCFSKENVGTKFCIFF